MLNMFHRLGQSTDATRSLALAWLAYRFAIFYRPKVSGFVIDQMRNAVLRHLQHLDLKLR